VLFVGCAGKAPEPVAVKGRVLNQKKPLAGVVVRFWREDKAGGSTDQLTDAEGKFSLTCLPGRYVVTVLSAPAAGGVPNPADAGATVKPGEIKSTIPPQYQDVERTPWRNIAVHETGRENLLLEITAGP
jgi:hypothetical protein